MAPSNTTPTLKSEILGKTSSSSSSFGRFNNIFGNFFATAGKSLPSFISSTSTKGDNEPDIIIIKLGGSSVTEKGQIETIKPDGLESACQIAKLCLDNDLRVIIVHGAGSFGHPQAKHYKVSSGYSDKPTPSEQNSVKYGFSVTRQSVLKLNHMITDRLVKLNINAVTLSPGCGSWLNDRKQVAKSDVETVKYLLDNNFVPILHGDGVMDLSLGCSILSGDTIIQKLATDDVLSSNILRVLFLTDVDGVFNKNPTEVDASLFSTLNVNKEKKLVFDSQQQGENGNANGVSTEDKKGSNKDDVTGGMELKLSTAINIVAETDGKIPVFICNVLKKSTANAAIKGEVDIKQKEGTVLRLIKA